MPDIQNPMPLGDSQLGSELTSLIANKPRLSITGLLISVIGTALLWFTVIAEIRFPDDLLPNTILIIRFSIAILFGTAVAIITYLISLKKYFDRLEAEAKEISPILNSYNFRKNLASASIYKAVDGYDPIPIKIADSYRLEGRIILGVDVGLDLKLGSRMVLSNDRRELLGVFVVDRKNETFWVARNTEVIDNLWYTAVMGEREFSLSDYYILFEVQ